MAASPTTAESNMEPQDNWGPTDDQGMGPGGNTEPVGGAPAPDNHRAAQDAENPDYPRGSSVDASISGSKADNYREKQVKPNKVYVGGLPEHTRQEDLQSCFGKIGHIVNIELKVGYGFVEFDSREAAEESVAKYHEGYFMGNKIRVELSHGGGRTAKYSGDPGACFKCGQMGHWARECPHHPQTGGGRRSHSDAPLIDRIQPSRDHPPPPRDYPPYRDDGTGRPPAPPRDRYYDYPPAPSGRDFRRPVTPPRDYRDYPRSREFEEFKRGPPPPPPSHRYEPRPGHYPPDSDGPPPGYPPRSYGGPPALPPAPPHNFYDRYERRPPPPNDRYPPSYPPPVASRARTPPGGPPVRSRDDFDRPPPAREYPPEFRGRLTPPPARYAPDYVSGRPGSVDASSQRYRRRSGSPPPRSAAPPYESSSYGNGYSRGASGGPPPGPPRGGSSRDYAPRNGRDAPESYRRP